MTAAVLLRVAVAECVGADVLVLVRVETAVWEKEGSRDPVWVWLDVGVAVSDDADDGLPVVEGEAVPVWLELGVLVDDDEGVPVCDEDGVTVLLELGVPVCDEDGVPVCDEDGVPVWLELGVPVCDEDGVPV